MTADSFVKWLAACPLLKQPKPPVYLVSIEGIQNMSNRFRVTLAIPPIAAQPDPPVKRELLYSLNGGETVTTVFEGDTLNTPTHVLEASQGDTLAGELRDVDDAGNASSTPFVFTIVDTVPPLAPGEVGVQSLEEIAE